MQNNVIHNVNKLEKTCPSDVSFRLINTNEERCLIKYSSIDSHIAVAACKFGMAKELISNSRDKHYHDISSLKNISFFRK